ncbi:MAG: hypothetical protein HQK76_21195 [Desulfobacterales bacterium]|nr:hypothetical protein [Desulfobacterales bacterium]
MYQKKFYVLIFLCVFNCICNARIALSDVIDDLASKAARKISECKLLKNVPELKLEIDNMQVLCSLETALASMENPYRISNKAPITIKAYIAEKKNYFWERPYKRISLKVVAVKNENIEWADEIKSLKEIIPSFWAIPIRIGIIILLWPILVWYCFSFSDLGFAKRKYFIIVWGIMSFCVVLSYIIPTYF